MSKCACIGSWGFGVWHFKDAGHASQYGRPSACFQVFLVLVARLAQMDLGVDHPWQHMQPGNVDPVSRIKRRQVADGGDPSIAHGDIGTPHPIMIDDRATRKNGVEGLGHRVLLVDRSQLPRITAHTLSSNATATFST